MKVLSKRMKNIKLLQIHCWHLCCVCGCFLFGRDGATKVLSETVAVIRQTWKRKSKLRLGLPFIVKIIIITKDQGEEYAEVLRLYSDRFAAFVPLALLVEPCRFITSPATGARTTIRCTSHGGRRANLDELKRYHQPALDYDDVGQEENQ
jgi:hypothetical protein